MGLFLGMCPARLTMTFADFWVVRDFDAPPIPNPRPADSSAATVAANALLLLAQQERTPAEAGPWIDASVRVSEC